MNRPAFLSTDYSDLTEITSRSQVISVLITLIPIRTRRGIWSASADSSDLSLSLVRVDGGEKRMHMSLSCAFLVRHSIQQRLRIPGDS